MKNFIKSIICISIVTLFFIPGSIGEENISQKANNQDFDPLVDISITVEIQKIRAFDKQDLQVLKKEYVDKDSNPDFFIKIMINNEEYTSDIWYDTKYIYSPDFSPTLNIPDDQELVEITIQLWDWNADGNVPCDIGNEDKDVDLVYSLKTGHWTGDDHLGDPSGYGRLNGCDDGSIYQRERDCELWFDIYTNDFDNDRLPYWLEVNQYETDPEIDNTDSDIDNDEIPIEWEWKWGYDPLVAENHNTLDPDQDSINNYEEYLTSQWGSDPFRKDIFIELDQMDEGPNGEKNELPQESKELLYTAYNRQNMVYHLDDGSWEDSGSNLLPFDDKTTHAECNYIYNQFFLNGDSSSWRKGVFHYGILIYNHEWIHGCAFGNNRFQISSKGLDDKAKHPILDYNTVYASAFMHETGHTFGFWPIPGHNPWSKKPWQIGWWISRPYKSCMNYGYMYYTVDYSDGSRPSGDYDDWARMDLSHFERS